MFKYICSCYDTTSSALLSLDIDECALGMCDSEASCTDLDGSFLCTCNRGYSGDGLSCSGLLLVE